MIRRSALAAILAAAGLIVGGTAGTGPAWAERPPEPGPVSAQVPASLPFIGTVTAVTVQGRAELGTPSALTARIIVNANAPTAVTVTVRAAGQRCVTRLDIPAGRSAVVAGCRVQARVADIPRVPVAVDLALIRTVRGVSYTARTAAAVGLPVVEGVPMPSAEAKARWAALSSRLTVLAAAMPADEVHGAAFVAARAWGQAHQTGWDSPQVAAWLDQLLGYRNPDGGFGLSVAWDAYQDGSVNPAETSYTVTTAGHVGWLLLEAHRQGVLPVEVVHRAVDSLLDHTARLDGGTCLAYSTAAADAATPCVYNVSFGGAAFLKAAAAATGYRAGDTAAVVAAVAGRLSAGYDPETGYWEYLAGAGQPQDISHQTYTATSADLVDPRFGAVARMMRAPWWSQPRTANSAPYVISASMISVAADCRYARLPGVLAGAELGARAGDPPFSVQNMLNVARIVQQRCFGATVQSRQVAPALPVGVGIGG
jgi:hypothetical protein